MARVLPHPTSGEVFEDPRGDGRVMRATWHHDDGMVVLSLWRDDTCTATFRLEESEAARLVALLANGLANPAAGYARRVAG